MLRSRDIPESKSASESDHYSDFEIVCPSWQPRRVSLFVIVAAGEFNVELLFAKCNGTRAVYWLVHCAEREWSRLTLAFCVGVGLLASSFTRHEVRLANLLNLSI